MSFAEINFSHLHVCCYSCAEVHADRADLHPWRSFRPYDGRQSVLQVVGYAISRPVID